MVKRSLEELKTYEGPGHLGMTAMRIHGKEETGAEKFGIRWGIMKNYLFVL